ncbi:MAG: ribonuclease P protein component [Prevotella sp.]|nr:ribonuclease P protein component [Prevotella sp.]
MTAHHSPVSSQHSLGRQERIKSRKLVEELFSGGNSHSVVAYPLRAVWKEGGLEGTQILVSVSKRHFKRAVKRNRVKRQLREAYRLNKQILLDALTPLTTHHSLHIAFIWQADELYPTSVVEDRMKTLLYRIAEKI